MWNVKLNKNNFFCNHNCNVENLHSCVQLKLRKTNFLRDNVTETQLEMGSGIETSLLAPELVLKAVECVIKEERTGVAFIWHPFSQTDPDVDDGRRHHDTHALQQVSHHVDEGGTDAGVAVGGAAEERVGVAVAVGGGVALAVLVDLVIAAAVGVEGGGVVEDVGHAARGNRETREFELQLAVVLVSD